MHKTELEALRERVQLLQHHVRTLCDAIQRDDTGILIGAEWVGGNGGLLSRETLVAADNARSALLIAQEPTNG
ncbi:MAG: hypothetical protein KGL39_48155 [Patescibacteria group bacterium]|nr:hypothetical protein [Patescibacteria group bacterium]